MFNCESYAMMLRVHVSVYDSNFDFFLKNVHIATNALGDNMNITPFHIRFLKGFIFTNQNAKFESLVLIASYG